MSSPLFALLLAASVIVPAMADEKSLPDLVSIGAPARQAELASIGPSGDLKFNDSAGETFTLPTDALVRWSNPAPMRAADVMVLSDGSRLGLAAAWGKTPSMTFDGARGLARLATFGRVEFDRTQVNVILWGLPPDESRQTQILEALTASGDDDGDSDLLLLDNGDRITGTLTRIGPAADQSDGKAANATLTFDGELGVAELPLERVRGVRLSRKRAESQSSAKLLVGLRDGSLLAAEAIRSDGEGLIIESPVFGDVKLGALNEVVSLQGAGERVVYLSDVEPVSYRYEPYLDLAWNYGRNRNALGGSLRAGGRTYLKGLGMHSASRLTFDLDGKHDRFAATIALDDAADGGGSVVFRAFLKPSDGTAWREAFASGVVRSGDAPQEVSIDLAGAAQLALVVDYADRGDERDYANWLDARLERTE
jgi:hypothetical protein